MQTTEREIELELLRLKDAALAATLARDEAFYRDYLAEEAIAVVPAGTFAKEEIVAAMGRGAFQSSRTDDVRAVPLGPEAGMVTYVATFGEGPEGRRAFVTTVYRRVGSAWRGVFYQQTDLATG